MSDADERTDEQQAQDASNQGFQAEGSRAHAPIPPAGMVDTAANGQQSGAAAGTQPAGTEQTGASSGPQPAGAATGASPVATGAGAQETVAAGAQGAAAAGAQGAAAAGAQETVAADTQGIAPMTAAQATPEPPAETPSDDGEQKKEKKAWPRTQRGLIILVVVLALVLGFVGGVAGSAVVELTGVFQQQPSEAASSQQDDMGGQSGQMPEGGQGQMGEAPEGGADGTDGSNDSDDASSDSDTATGSFTA